MAASREYQDAQDLESFLATTTGERGISAMLLSSPQILYWTLSRGGGHDRYVFREFPLGSRYKVDFVVLNSYSGSWQVNFIELEPVDCRPLTKSGIPSARLAGALKQVEDWADYFSNNKEQVRADLVRWAATTRGATRTFRAKPVPCPGGADAPQQPRAAAAASATDHVERTHARPGARPAQSGRVSGELARCLPAWSNRRC